MWCVVRSVVCSAGCNVWWGVLECEMWCVVCSAGCNVCGVVCDMWCVVRGVMCGGVYWGV